MRKERYIPIEVFSDEANREQKSTRHQKPAISSIEMSKGGVI